ncbi:MAG: PAC2 family protein [Candidatus Anstonellaceae archaeon]
MDIEFVLFKNIKLKNPIIIQGFPGAGLVGTMSSLYLVEKLNMELVGYIQSSKFPPIAAIHRGKPHFPARIYASKKHNLIIILSEFVIPTHFIFYLAEQIYLLAKKLKAKKIISLGSILKKEEEQIADKIYAVVSTSNLAKELEKNNIHVIKEGVTTGVSSFLLSKGAIDNFEVISLLSNSSNSSLDLMACYNLLSKLKNYLDLDIDLKDLELDAKKMEEQMEKIAQKIQNEQMVADKDREPSMYQ